MRPIDDALKDGDRLYADAPDVTEGDETSRSAVTPAPAAAITMADASMAMKFPLLIPNLKMGIKRQNGNFTVVS